MFGNLVRILTVACVLAFAGTARADDQATADEAVALVKKAVALYKSDGQAKALAAFLTPAFQPKDLFVIVQDTKGIMIQHPKNPAFNGKDQTTVKDADGKLFDLEQVNLAREKGSGWVEYKWVNPQTKKLQPKQTYIERCDDVIIGAGIYK